MYENQQSNKNFGYLDLDNASNNSKKFFIILISIFVVLLIVFIVLMNRPEKKQAVEEQIDFNENLFATTTDQYLEQGQIFKLPIFESSESSMEKVKLGSLKAEILSFGNFYEKDELTIENKIKKIDLPINIKTDVSNYYDISRKINFNEKMEDLNNNGFSILENPFEPSVDDFFAAYEILGLKEIPILITSDFLIYIYQNNIKEVFKDIEENVFYNDMWDIASELFRISDTRYRVQLEKRGMINDPALEGARLASAYFATLLKILEPRKNQIFEDNQNKSFNSSDANVYKFMLPSYLQEDVTKFLKEDVVKEVNLVVEAKEKTKSPVLHYVRDYTIFNLPNEYKRSSKLGNFHLATIWMNSIFPLYYKSESCENCSLDKDDWIINMIAANFIAQDLSDNQYLKNKWAKIYKTLSYFKGLKSGLTYLHYQDAYNDVFGGRQIEDVFSLNNKNIDNDIKKFQEKITDYNFLKIEGGFNLKNSYRRPTIGIRMLQEQYWPNDYIFSELINPMVGGALGDGAMPITGCKKSDKENVVVRCGGIGMDVINLLLSEPVEESYFQENTNYENYEKQVSSIKDALNNFDVLGWHNNIYWNTLGIVRSFLDYESSKELGGTLEKEWLLKNINTSLGAWTNLHLPHDILKIKIYGQESSLMAGRIVDSYVEPNLALIQELVANTQMLKKMLLSLEVINENSFSLIKLSNLEIELENIKEIVVKELNNEDLDYNDFKKIDDLIKRLFVKEKGEKTLKLNFKDTPYSIVEKIDGVKFLLKIISIKDKNTLFIGPIFNHIESK